MKRSHVVHHCNQVNLVSKQIILAWSVDHMVTHEP